MKLKIVALNKLHTVGRRIKILGYAAKKFIKYFTSKDQQNPG